MTSNCSASYIVFDSLGGEHTVNLFLVMQGEGAWTYHALANGSEVQKAARLARTLSLRRGSCSSMPTRPFFSCVPSGGSVTFYGAAPQTIAFDLGTPISEGGTGLDGLTDFGMNSGITAESQNGHVCW